MEYTTHTKVAIEQMVSTGAFMTTQGDQQVNTMAIAWGSIGFLLGKPVFTAMIRQSRYTYELLRKSGEFTISIPEDEDMASKVYYCGKHSGREVNKIEACQLPLQDARSIATPIIPCHGVHFECKVLVTQPMTTPLWDSSLQQEHEIEGDPYIYIIGEICSTYRL
jgi:flavin reductase (DIM6/NTAB) family NADH-FMN oxidoreductase RutF